MTAIVKAADAAHLLALVPRMFGFTPTRSAVVVPFAQTRSVGGMRVDLPHESAVDAAAATLVGMVCRVEDADALLLVVYDDDAGAGRDADAFAAAVRARADACGIRVVDALHVGPVRWHSCADPAVGGEVRDLSAGTDAGAPPEGDQHSGAELVPADEATCRQTARAVQELSVAMHLLAGAPAQDDEDPRTGDAGSRVDPAALATTVLLDDLPLFFEWWVEPERERPPSVPEHYARAALVWCLARPALRDIGITTWMGGLDAGDQAVEGQLRWEAGEEYPMEAAQHMWGDGPRPDPERLITALNACRDAASVAPVHERAGALAACAWLSWALGRMTHADSYARRACEDEPGHGLAMIVLTFVSAGHLPDWAFRRGAT